MREDEAASFNLNLDGLSLDASSTVNPAAGSVSKSPEGLVSRYLLSSTLTPNSSSDRDRNPNKSNLNLDSMPGRPLNPASGSVSKSPEGLVSRYLLSSTLTRTLEL